MPRAIRGVLIECDPSIKSIIVSIDSANHDYIIEDLDDERVVVKENMVSMLKAKLEDLRKSRLRLLQPTHQTLREVLALHGRRIPHLRIPQALRNADIPSMVDQLLCSLHRNRALLSKCCRQRHAGVHSGLFAVVNLAHKAYRERLLRRKVPRCETHVLDPRCRANKLRKARECANIGSHTNINFFDSEARVGCADADIRAAGNINGETDRNSMKNANDSLTLTFFTLLHSTNGVLELLNVTSQNLRLLCDVGVRTRQNSISRSSLHIQTCGKRSIASTTEHYGAYILIMTELVEDIPKLKPDLLRERVELLRAVDLNKKGSEEGEGSGGSGDVESTETKAGSTAVIIIVVGAG
ncbi:hypothetical protein HG530_013578 [Fusarium avenaceum]|nr:hypothetical protein HG530_013578 [Fusarium avenaceum]